MAISLGGATCNGRMFWHLILTDACNLCCSYCRGKAFWPREEPGRPCAYDPSLPAELAIDLDDLAAFLARDPDPTLTFYGGEPLLRSDLVEDVMACLPRCRFMLQTNGLLLDRLPPDILHRFHTLLVSVDGPEALTDRHRGEGVYARVLANVERLVAERVPGRADRSHDRGRGHGDRGGRAPLRRSSRLGSPLAARREFLGRLRHAGLRALGAGLLRPGDPTTRRRLGEPDGGGGGGALVPVPRHDLGPSPGRALPPPLRVGVCQLHHPDRRYDRPVPGHDGHDRVLPRPHP